MAKKKRKKRRPAPARPDAQAAPPARGDRASHRQERKEQARRERERRIRAARRRQRLRRAVRWGIVGAVIAGGALLIWWQITQGRRLEAAAAEAAQQLGCDTEVQDLPDEGRQHLQPGQPPPDYRTTPAASGPHTAAPLPPDPSVYDQPVPEATAVHNLEHGYVLIYYRADGDGALPDDVRDALAGIAEQERKVLMAPYPELPEGTSLALMGWTKTLQCPEVTDAEAVATVVRASLDKLRANAPEPQGV